MKKVLIINLILSLSLFPQTFRVEKVSGKVTVQKGTSEKWTAVKVGNSLSANDLLQTGKNSSAQISNGKEKFTLKSTSAIMPGSIKRISQNDLLLALTLEDIKSLPKNKKNSNTKSTAVYGSELNNKEVKTSLPSDIGIKKLNGAKQLAESGFRESSLLVAKETFRKYPETQNLIPERIYFADIFEKLSLYEEAQKEFNQIYSMNISFKEKALVKKRIDQLSQKLQ